MDEKRDRMHLQETKDSLHQNEPDDVKDYLQTAVWEDNPHFPAGDPVLRSQFGNATLFTKGKRKTSGLSTFFVTFIIIGWFAITFSRTSLQSVEEEISLLLSNREQSRKIVQGFEKRTQLIHHKLLALDVMIQRKRDPSNFVPKSSQIPYRNGENADELEEFNMLEKIVESLKASSENLKSQIQEVGRKEVEEKYGSGVHRVEIRLVFPDGEGPDTFVLELAPIDLMPHSVHFFLDVVSAGLLDGCSFILNAPHILTAAPLPYDGSSAAEKAREFTKRGLESVAFKEYSESFPHKMYTVGFAVDGSPSFYINTEDNRNVHAGDPCFGKIISGFNALQRLEEIQIINGIWLKQRVGIKLATIV